MLAEEIVTAQRLVRTDAYQMSIGELVSMYEKSEIIIDPDFQRLFRWNIGQKSKLIESLLLGIPLPSIFVFEKDDGRWELIDGLQRLSTILEFMGQLRGPAGGLEPPSVLEATKYLPAMHNAVWELSDRIDGVSQEEQVPFDKSHQLAIRRARISVEILKRPSDNLTKFDLFQRLNAGGTQANAQELRNCVMIMVSPQYFGAVREAAESDVFKMVMNVNEDQVDRQRHLEYAVRFLVHALVDYDGRLDVEEYIDEGIVQLATVGDPALARASIIDTFSLLSLADGDNVLRRFDGLRHLGKIGLVGLEGIAVGVAKNFAAISALADPSGFVRERAQQFWLQNATSSFTSPGLRGTTRIQRTVPFGEEWFRP